MIDENLENLPLEKQIEISENIVKKNFTFSEMAALDDEFAPKVENEFKQRQGKRQHLGNLPKGQKRTSEVMGSYFGKSEKTYRKFREIKDAIEKNPEKFNDLGERIDNGMSIEYAHKMVRTTEKANTPTPDLPTGKYDLVYLDPPWEYDLKLTGAPPYKTMTLEEMKISKFQKLLTELQTKFNEYTKTPIFSFGMFEKQDFLFQIWILQNLHSEHIVKPSNFMAILAIMHTFKVLSLSYHCYLISLKSD